MDIEDEATVISDAPARVPRRFARLLLADGRKCWAELLDDMGFLFSDAPWNGGSATAETIASIDRNGVSAHVRRLAPAQPTKILCVGRNYKAHAQELGHEVPAEPLLFLKPPSSLLDPGGSIELPPADIATRVEHEAELGVIIGRRARRVSAADALSYVFGLTLLCDVTARDLQKKDGQWTRAKGMDTFCPLGPVIVTGLDPQSLRIVCRVNGTVRQEGSTADMVFSVAELIAHASRCITLEPGDVLATGTPAGVGPLQAGDRMEINVPEIGTLRASVVAT
jgi:2-keto-4-pentenoate hydratase/2-oxohepta-3-ene-1,7-dioic acid hydratase in catechol pathway